MKQLIKNPVVSSLMESLQLIKKYPLLLLVASILDAVFFFAYGFFTTPVSDKIVAHASLLSNEMSKMLAEGKTGLLFHLFDVGVRGLTGKLILLMFLLFGITYLLYCIFHGSSWFLARKIAEKNIDYKDYILGFAKVNLIWIFAIIIYKIVDVIVSVRYSLLAKFAPGTPNILGGFLIVFLLALIFIALFSYPSLKAKALLKIPASIAIPAIILAGSLKALPVFVGEIVVSNISGFITEFIMTGVVIGAVQFVLNMISKINTDAALLIGLIVLFPAMVLMKVFLVRVCLRTH